MFDSRFDIYVFAVFVNMNFAFFCECEFRVFL